MEQIQEKVILIAIDRQQGEDVSGSLDELEELCHTAGATAVGRIIQLRDFPHPALYLGSGKIDELKDLIYETGATGVVADDELSPSQMKNLENELDVKVMDRTVLILDIFAQRATSAEGKIQVELAQLKYSLTRLSGYGKSMSRLGGGIGTRGPGETKLESDRRVVKNRVVKLNHELKEVVKHRAVTRSKRDRNNSLVAAIVGYTNAGKSTLLNKLTNSEVLSEDKLFATLDPTTREYKLPSGSKILLTDTVGFINKLPHHLVEAFKSTLEEAKYSDIIIHVVDSSDKDADRHMEVVYETLRSLDITNKPIVTLFNKCDNPECDFTLKDLRADKTYFTSAITGTGLSEFSKGLEDILRSDKQFYEGIISFDKGSLLSKIREKGEIIEEEYTENGVKIKAFVPSELFGKL